jgi:hypothetical protein
VGAPPLELYLGPAGRHLFVATKATQQIFDTTTKKAVYDSKEPGFVAGVSADGGTLLVAHGDMTTAAENWDRGGYTYVAQEAWSVLDLCAVASPCRSAEASQGGPSTWFGLSPDGDTVYEHAESSVTLYAAADAKERQRVQLPGLDLPFGGAGIFPHVDGKHIMVSGQAYALDGWKKLDEAAALALDAPPPIHPFHPAKPRASQHLGAGHSHRS